MRKLRSAILIVLFTVFMISKYGNEDFLQQCTSKFNDVTNMVHAAGIKHSDFEKGKIVRVVDGDTFVVSINGEEKKVRLIGVDTPESVSNNKNLKNTSYGKKVKKYVKKLLKKGTDIKLEYDEQETDVYGRTLAYMYYKNKKGKYIMLNEQLLQKGYARAVYYSPNDKYREKFAEYHNTAKDNKKGFWGVKKSVSKSFLAAFPTKNENEY